jgi:hypothetical protein
MNAIVTQTTKLLPRLPSTFTSGDQLVSYVKGCESIRKAVNEAIDYRIGEALSKAKEDLAATVGHGHFFKACEELGYSKEDSARFRRWYEEVKGAQCARLDPATAEQKLSRKAREEFCRAPDEVKAVVIEDIAKPEITKITAADIKRMSPARELQPGEKTHSDYNKIIQLFEQIDNLTHANEFTDNFSREEWFSLLGSWQSVGDGIRSKCDYIRRHESNREGAITVDCQET